MTIDELKKVKEPREHKIKGSLGVYDFYKKIRKNKWLNIGQPLTEHLFYTIIRRINEFLANDLILGKKVTFPYNMGTIELRKRTCKISIVDGKLVTSLPVDWDRTLKLWAEDGKSKTLIRLENKEVYRTIYNKQNANYKNKGFYRFTLNRGIKVALKKQIKYNKIDAYILW